MFSGGMQSNAFMKLFMLSLLAAALTAFGDDTAKNSSASIPPGPQTQNTAWSVTGKWHGNHNGAWDDTVTILPDGTFHRGQQGDTGHWTLAASGDKIILVLAWDNWGAEAITMQGPDDFSSRVLTLHRDSALAAAIETRTWRQGEPPVKIMRKDEGFCVLSMVTGHFQGGGEYVKVYVGDDGYWYLGGDSHQEGVAAQCIVIRYPKAAAESKSAPSDDANY
jgi:hypothetical protein